MYSWNAADRIDSEPGDDCYNSWWDLRTVNNQEVAPGLYLFSVEHEGKTISCGVVGIQRLLCQCPPCLGGGRLLPEPHVVVGIQRLI